MKVRVKALRKYLREAARLVEVQGYRWAEAEWPEAMDALPGYLRSIGDADLDVDEYIQDELDFDSVDAPGSELGVTLIANDRYFPRGYIWDHMANEWLDAEEVLGPQSPPTMVSAYSSDEPPRTLRPGSSRAR